MKTISPAGLLGFFLLFFQSNASGFHLYDPAAGHEPEKIARIEKTLGHSIADSASLGQNLFPPCNAPVISCGGAPINSTTVGAGNNYDMIDYQSCINVFGQYDAGDKLYKFTISATTSVHFVLNMDAGVNLDLMLLSECNPAMCKAASTEDNTISGIYREVLDVRIDPGVYYLVVDGPDATSQGGFSLSANCTCTCVEVSTDLPTGEKIFCDNFSDYLSGQNLDQQSTRWSVWNSSFADGKVETNLGDKYARFVPGGTVQSNMLYNLEGKQTGRYRASWKMYIPNGKKAYYNIVHNANNLAYEVFFNGDNTGQLVVPIATGGSTTIPFVYPSDFWFNITNIIDLDATALTTLLINNNYVYKWDFKRGTLSSTNKTLGSINFRAGTGHDFRVDDICIWQKGAPCNSPVYQPICMKNGQLYDNELESRCDLFTSKEWFPCYNACDLGGTFVYRGDLVTGGFDSSDFSFPGDGEACLEALDPVPYYMDVYIFNKTDTTTFNFPDNLGFQSSDPNAQIFAFGCKVPIVAGGPCVFKRGGCYIPNDTTSLPCNNFIYITVIGPANTTYSFQIIPNGNCPTNPPILAPGTPETGTISGGSGTTLSTAGGAYSQCYSSTTRTYLGGEAVYKFTLQQPSNVTLSLNSTSELGMFLFASLCAVNCVDAAETAPTNPSTTMTTALNDGTYYVVLDNNAGAGDYNLTLQTSPLAIFTNFIPGAVCAINPNATHTVTIQNTAYNFTDQDQIHFLFRDTDGSLKSSDSLFRVLQGVTNTPITIPIHRDVIGDGVKCSYDVSAADTFIIYLAQNQNGRRVFKKIIPTFRPVPVPPLPNLTATNKFTVGAYSIIDVFTVKDTVNFGTTTLELNPSAGASMATIPFSSTEAWDATKPSWVMLDPPNSPGAENITATFESNPSEAPRSGTIKFYSVAHPNEYRQYVQVNQKGVCNPNPALSISATKPAICTGESTTLTAEVGIGLQNVFSYKWSNDATTPSITVSPGAGPALYTVTITNTQAGCIATKTAGISITVTPPPTANAGSTQTLNCNPATIQLNGTGSSSGPGISYSWSGTGIVSGGATLTPIVNQGGLYTLSVTSGICVATATVQVIANNVPPLANAGPTQSLLCVPPTVQLSGSATGGTNYAWSGPGIVSGANTLTPIVNQSGTYVLTVTNSVNSCTSTASTTVNANNTPPSANAGPAQTLLCVPPTVQLNGSASGGTVYNWSGPGIVSGGNTLSPVVNLGGTYSLTVTNSTNGCTAGASVLVNLNTIPPIANAGPLKMISCTQAAVQLDGSASSSGAGFSYLWSGPGVVSGGTTTMPSVNQSGTYALTVTNTTNGCTAVATVQVNGDANLPSVNAGAPQVISCNQTTVQLNGSGSAGPEFSYSWTGPGILSGGTTLTPTVNLAGTYVLTVANTGNACSASASVQVSGNTTHPTADAGAPQTISCIQPTPQLNGSGSSGTDFNYSWSGPGIVSGGSTLTPLVNLAGTYTLTVNNLSNFCTASATVQVSGNTNLPTAGGGASQILLCNPPTVQLNGSGSGGSDLGYAWSGPGIVSGGNTLSPSVNQAGTYVLTVTNNANSCTATASAQVSSNTNLPTANGGPDKVLSCSQQSVQLNGSGSTGGNFSYLWNGPGIVSGGTTLTPTVNQVGTYTLVVTNTTNGCTKTATAQVTANTSVPSASGGAFLSITCTQQTVQLNGTGSTGPEFSYLWSGTGIISGGTTLTPFVNMPGTFTLTVTNTNNNCTAVASTQVLPDNVPPNANAGPMQTLGCNPPAISLFGTGSAGGNIMYSWTGPAIVSGGNSLTPTVNQPGTYTLLVSNSGNGCSASSTTTVNSNTVAPPANAGPPKTLLCNPSTVTLAGSPVGTNYTYTWSGLGIVSGATTATPVVNQAGTYILTVTNTTNGCTAAAATQVIPDNIPPILNSINNETLLCIPPTVTLSGGPVNPNLAYSWTGPGIVSGGTTPSPVVNQAGTYILTATASTNGCTASTSTQVIPNNTPPVANAGNNQTLLCVPPTLTLSGGPAGPNFQYIWSGPGIISGDITLNPMVNQGGDYTLTVVNTENGCTGTDVVQVIANNTPPTGNAGQDQTSCPGEGVPLGNGSNPSYVYNWSPGTGLSSQTAPLPVATPLSTQVYTLVVTNPDNECITTDSVLVTVFPPIVSNVDILNPIVCNGDFTGILALTISGGTPDYAVVWSNSAGSTQIENLGPGTYTAYITDQKNCKDTSNQVTLINPPVITADTIIAFAASGQNNGSIEIQVSGGVPDYQYQWSQNNQELSGETENHLDALSAGTGYTVVVTDQNGCTATFGPYATVSTDEPGWGAHILITPNPNDGHFYLRCEGLELRTSDIEILDLLGRKIQFGLQEKVPEQAWEIDLSDYPPGPYFVKIRQGKTTVTRIVLRLQ